ncbi:MAG: hypothetical protein QNJ68_18935 [Microcoleaceae cyanobacterium MO_207.B10]|nr:hypothetical protein [Microcoleaceae cyanobacterium MO_207.B10]
MTQNKQRENWVVICGLVRDRQLFNTKLEKLCQWQNEGLISGIVYSTWIGEIDKYEGLRQQLEIAGVKTVEIQEPNLRLPGHLLHQMKTIYYGLEACPENSYVLKIRPDLCSLGRNLIPILSGEVDLKVDNSEGWPNIFRERLVIMGGFVTAPFYINDILFYGSKQDVKKLIHFDLRYEVLFSSTGPEQWFHAHPFIDSFQIFASYFPISPGIFHNNREKAVKYIDYFLSSPFLLKVFMTYVLILSRYYRVGGGILSHNLVAKELETIKKIPYATLFKEDTNVPGILFQTGPNSVRFRAESWIYALLNGGFAKDEVGEKLEAVLMEVKEWSFQQNWIANSLTPPPEVIEVADNFKQLFSLRQNKIANQLEIEGGRRFVIKGGNNRFQVVNNDVENKKLEQEILRLRRQIVNLNETLQQKDRGIHKLT